MKQVKIKNLKYPDPAINWDFKAEDWQIKLEEILQSGVCGQSERWVLHKDEFGSEPYDDSDVLEEELRPDPLLIDNSKKWVKLKAEYTVEIEDITAQYELEQCIAKRRAEYPSAEQFLNAFFDGGESGLEELRQKRLVVKAKYPKP